MRFPKVWQNPFFYVFLMDMKADYFFHKERAEDKTRVEIEKQFDREKFSSRKTDLEEVFDFYNVIGREEFIESIVKTDPHCKPDYFGLKSIRAIIYLGVDEDALTSQFVITITMGESSYKLKMNIQMELQLDYEFHSVFRIVPLGSLEMVSRVTFISFIQSVLQRIIDAEGNFEEYLNKFQVFFC